MRLAHMALFILAIPLSCAAQEFPEDSIDESFVEALIETEILGVEEYVEVIELEEFTELDIDETPPMSSGCKGDHEHEGHEVYPVLSELEDLEARADQVLNGQKATANSADELLAMVREAFPEEAEEYDEEAQDTGEDFIGPVTPEPALPRPAID